MSTNTSSIDGARAENNVAMEKATTADFSEGALLSPEQFEDFMQDAQETPRVLGDAREFTPEAPSGDIPRLDIPPRQLVDVDEATDPGQEATYDQPDVDYETTKVSIQHEFSWEALNEVIDDPESTIRSMFTDRFGADLEVLASVGDTSASGFEAIEDGWLTRADARGSPVYHHDDAGDGTGSAQPINTTLFNQMFQELPDKYKDDDGDDDLVYLVSLGQKQEYKNFLTDRSTAAGDMMLMSGDEPTPYGRAINSPLGWPDNRAMLTTLDNLGYVIQDRLRTKTTTEAERNVRADIERIMALYAKIDYVVLDEEGIVTADGIAAPA